MVRMIPDKAGRFARRPFYDRRELDNECEGLIRDLLLKRRGEVEYPVSTDDLTMLIELHDADLDPYADLARFGQDVEGVTEFFPDRGEYSTSMWPPLEIDLRGDLTLLILRPIEEAGERDGKVANAQDQGCFTTAHVGVFDAQDCRQSGAGADVHAELPSACLCGGAVVAGCSGYR